MDGFVLGPTRKILDMAAGTLDVSLYALKSISKPILSQGIFVLKCLKWGKKNLKQKIRIGSR